ncbi:hypothetical protein T492DRAFT_835246 [Pavlovales sp. CCMP2436]|nr:hypothetical protein T492DRAFT_835246 [Pavlovales sp. CCMP2436]
MVKGSVRLIRTVPRISCPDPRCGFPTARAHAWPGGHTAISSRRRPDPRCGFPTACVDRAPGYHSASTRGVVALQDAWPGHLLGHPSSPTRAAVSLQHAWLVRLAVQAPRPALWFPYSMRGQGTLLYLVAGAPTPYSHAWPGHLAILVPRPELRFPYSMRGHGTWPFWRWAGYARERAAKRAPAPRSEQINAKRLAASGPRDSSRCQSMDEQRALSVSITSRRVSRNISSPISSEYPAATRAAAFQPAATLSREPSGLNGTGAAVCAAGSDSSARDVAVVGRGARRPCTKGLTLGAAPDESATPEVSANPEAWRIAVSAESPRAGKNGGACPNSRVARITGGLGEVKRPPRRPKRPSGP